MKKCPVCDALTFDDATTCFGCLHRFDVCNESSESQEGRHGKNAIRGVIPGRQEAFSSTALGSKRKAAVEHASDGGHEEGWGGQPGAAFIISVLPQRTAEGTVTWTCNVAAQGPSRVRPTYA